jgi:probable F420-dependent oxidoreductase
MPPTTLELPTVGAWTVTLNFQPLAEARDHAVELEELDYRTFWFPEANGPDLFVVAATLLAATREVQVGTAVANIWARDPLAMSCAANALTAAYPERFLLGLGISHQLLVEGMRGQVYDKPLATMRAYLDGMDAATYSGAAPTTPPRRFLAALGPKMLELARDRTEGTLPYMVTPEHTAIARAAIPDGHVCSWQAMVIDDDPSRARETARANHTAFYMQLPNYTNNLRRLGFTDEDFADGGSDRLVDALVAQGSVETCIARMQEHLDAGASHVVTQVITATPRVVPMDQWRELAPGLKELQAR